MFVGFVGNSVEIWGELLSREFFLGIMKVVLCKVGGMGFGEEK